MRITSSLFFSVIVVFFCFVAKAEKNAKYVFLLIAEGLNPEILGLYLEANEDAALNRFDKLLETESKNSSGTAADSAAAATAIACGIKTANGFIGMNDKKEPVNSLAAVLRNQGWKIGVISNNQINSAMPAANFAFRREKGQVAQILTDMYNSQFLFFGVSSLDYPVEYSDRSLLAQLNRRKYTIYKNNELFSDNKRKKYFVFATLGDDAENEQEFSPARKAGPESYKKITISEMTSKAASLLKNDKGFFISITADIAQHLQNEDTIAAINSLQELDHSLKEALKFYDENPNETLIVFSNAYTVRNLMHDYKEKNSIKNFVENGRSLADIETKLIELNEQKLSEADFLSKAGDFVGLNALSDSQTKKLKENLPYFALSEEEKVTKFPQYSNFSPLAQELLRLQNAQFGISYSADWLNDQPAYSNFLCAQELDLPDTLETQQIPFIIANATLGKDFDLTKEMSQTPMPPTKSVDYFSFLSASSSELSLIYGIINKRKLRFTLQDTNGKNIVKETNENFGRISFENLSADSEYLLKIEDEEGLSENLKARTQAVPNSKKILDMAILSDTHISLKPGPGTRLHACSVDAMSKALIELEKQKCPLIIHAGDLTDAALVSELLATEEILKLFSGKFLVAPGNHDRKRTKKFAQEWARIFGADAGYEVINSIQFIWLNTLNGKLDNKGNLDAVAKLDPEKPAIIFTHFQLIRDDYIQDKHAGISDLTKPNVIKMLDIIKNSNSIIFVGHKNIATRTMLGKAPQYNMPQTTQFPAGYLQLEVFEDGILQKFIPSLEPYEEEISRRYGSVKHTRAKYAFEYWNCFIPWPSKTNN